ncbi:hypothetical protein JCM18382A_14940 [Bradyrhizobium sp. 17-4]
MTPWAIAGAASIRLHAATAAKNPDFIVMLSQQFFDQEKSTRHYFITRRLPIDFSSAKSMGLRCLTPVIPGRAQREPGIHRAAVQVDEWIPGSPLRGAPE